MSLYIIVALFYIAGFATGYGVRSLVSARRQRRAVRTKYGSLTSDYWPTRID